MVILKKHSILALSSILSLALLGFFLYLQSGDSRILQLEVQWIAVSILPVLIALFAGGYIAKFKGFGIELESKLEAPISSMQLTATDAIDELPGNEKESLADLHRITDQQKRNAKRISFNLDKKGYYGSYAIEDYINNLRNVEYLEVKRDNGEFVCLLPISLFKSKTENELNVRTDYNAINRFQISIDEGNVLSVFANSAITLTVQSSTGLLEVLKTLRNNDATVAGVLSKEKKLIGVITSALVEKRIADDVLGTKA